MNQNVTRREMLAAAAAAGVGLWTAGHVQAAEFTTTIHKAMIDSPTEPALKKLKEAGFEGIETGQWNVTPEQAAKGRKIAEKLGMKIHSVLFGWANFNQKDHVEKDVANVEKALHACKGYGASALLLVPCLIGGMPMPEAWEFELDFDPKTGKLNRVVAGDNSKYEAYIKAQNEATAASHKAVRRLIPTAEKAGVIIALENVWNNLWVKPAFFAQFITSFKNPWVQCYFDIGNHVKYAPAEEWIRALGKTIVKLHVKDFKLNPNGHGGNFVHPRDGSVDWPLVRQELDKIGYNDWMTIEDGGLSLEEFSRRLDLIVAGK